MDGNINTPVSDLQICLHVFSHANACVSNTHTHTHPYNTIFFKAQLWNIMCYIQSAVVLLLMNLLGQ